MGWNKDEWEVSKTNLKMDLKDYDTTFIFCE